MASLALAVAATGVAAGLGSCGPLSIDGAVVRPDDDGGGDAAACVSGAPDPTFGSGGTTVLAFTQYDYFGRIAMDPAGRFIVAAVGSRPGGGHALVVARVLPDGTLDSSFAEAGYTSLNVELGKDGKVDDLAFQSDGRIVLALEIYSETKVDGGAVVSRRYIAAARVDAKGVLDESFPRNDLGEMKNGARVVVQPDDKIVLATTMGDTFMLVRLEANGATDLPFGDHGFASAFSAARLDTLALDRQARILSGGRVTVNTDPKVSALALARHLPDGKPDPSFGSSGTVADLGAGESANDLLLEESGSILFGGSVSEPGVRTDLAIGRRFDDGGADPSFGDGSVTVVRGRAPFSWDVALARDEEGILVVGSAYDTPYPYVGGTTLLARFTPNGGLDPAFGDAGQVYQRLAAGEDVARVIVQPDRKIVVASSIYAPQYWAGTILLTRYCR